MFAQSDGYEQYDLPQMSVKGKVKEIIMSQYYPSPGADTAYSKMVSGFQTVYRFDRKGRLKESVLTHNAPEYKNWEEKKDYKYYGDDSLVEYDYKGRNPSDPKTNELFLNSFKTLNSYNAKHQLTEKKFYANGKVFFKRTTYTYDSKGYVVQQNHYDAKNELENTGYFINDSTGHHIDILLKPAKQGHALHITCTYDNNGNLTAVHDTSSISFRLKYEWDSHGNWVKVLTYTANDPAKVYYITERKIRYY
jgi:YD repeat-containing protein